MGRSAGHGEEERVDVRVGWESAERAHGVVACEALFGFLAEGVGVEG